MTPSNAESKVIGVIYRDVFFKNQSLLSALINLFQDSTNDH